MFVPETGPFCEVGKMVRNGGLIDLSVSAALNCIVITFTKCSTWPYVL